MLLRKTFNPSNCSSFKRCFRTSPRLCWIHPKELGHDTLVKELKARKLPVAESNDENINILCSRIEARGGFEDGLTTDVKLAQKKREVEAQYQVVPPKLFYKSSVLIETRYSKQINSTLSEADKEKIVHCEKPYRYVISGRYQDVVELRDRILEEREKLIHEEENEIVYVIPNVLAPKLSSQVLSSMKQETKAKYNLYKLSNSETFLLVIKGDADVRYNACTLLERTFSDTFTKAEFSKSRKTKKQKASQQILDELTQTKKQGMVSIYVDPTLRDLVINQRSTLLNIANAHGVELATVVDDPNFYKPFEISISGTMEEIKKARIEVDRLVNDLRGRVTSIQVSKEELKHMSNVWQLLNDFLRNHLNVEIKITREHDQGIVYIVGGFEERKAALKIVEYQIYKANLVESSLQKNSLRQKREELRNLNFRQHGIGGLEKELKTMMRRTFESRCVSDQLRKEMDITHTKGVLLYGPPGTGKTLIARKISGILGCAEPKIVNSPEVESKWVGEAEKNIRALFEDAIKEQEEKGSKSGLHVIIFDELDAIAKRRGGAHAKSRDGAINQLLCSLDGIQELENVIIFGLTNRMDALDPALLRPGRLEVQLEIGLPDADARADILEIHTANMRKYGRIDETVDFQALAQYSNGFSGADLAGFVRNAQSLALEEFVEEDDCIVNQEHLERALQESRLSKLNAPPIHVEENEEQGLSIA